MFNVNETEFEFEQSKYLPPGTHNDVRKGVCYALSYLWIRQGLTRGGHLQYFLQNQLQSRFHNTGEGSRVQRASPEAFLRYTGGGTGSLGQEVFSMQRAIKAQQDILQARNSALAFNSGLATVVKRDGLREHVVARGADLNRLEPFSTFLKWMRAKALELNRGFALIGYTGPSSGHAIAMQIVDPMNVDGQWRFFDPNLGSYVLPHYARLKVELHELGLLYVAQGSAAGSWMVSTFR